LGIAAEKISVKDNFFEIGGHSLKATRLVSRIHKEFDVKVNIKDLFDHPVLEAQACLMERVTPAHFVIIPVLPLQADYGLSSSQRRLWILNKLDEESAAYHIPAVYVLEGPLNYEAFKLSFNSLLERHEVLRTVFREDVQGEIRQVICPLEETGFEVVYQNLQPNEEAQDVNDRINQDLAVPFDLISGPLVRARLYNLAENRWIFTYTMHHIISDGWSMEILIKELLHFYNAYSTGDAHALPPLRIQYKDYAAWQQQELKSDVLSGHRSYWLKQFDGELPVLALTGDYTRPLIKTYHGEVVSINIEQELSHEFKRLAGQQGGTLFMGLLTALNVLLHRHSGQEDLIVGSPIAGRENIDLEDQIGFYVNTLALRSRFKGTDSFKDLLGHVKQVTLDAYAHQVFPFDELVDALQLQRDMSRSPLFDVMLVLQNNGGGNEKEQQFGELSVSAYEGGENLTSKFDLTFSFVELPQGLRLSVNYNSDIFSRDSAIGFAAHLKHLLGTIVASPDQAIGKLDYLFAAEKAILLDAFNTTTVAYPEDKTITALFEAQVNST
ncbi:aryl carrier-like protein, partial [Pedobacter cryoconitis]